MRGRGGCRPYGGTNRICLDSLSVATRLPHAYSNMSALLPFCRVPPLPSPAVWPLVNRPQASVHTLDMAMWRRKQRVYEQQPRLSLLFMFRDGAAAHQILFHCESRALGLAHTRCEARLVHSLEKAKLIDPACVRGLELRTSSSLSWRSCRCLWWRSLSWRRPLWWRPLLRWSFRHYVISNSVAHPNQ